MEYFVKKKVDVFVNLPTGNGKSLIYQADERGTGVWERVYSGHPPDNLIQNGGRRKRTVEKREDSKTG